MVGPSVFNTHLGSKNCELFVRRESAFDNAARRWLREYSVNQNTWRNRCQIHGEAIFSCLGEVVMFAALVYIFTVKHKFGTV